MPPFPTSPRLGRGPARLLLLLACALAPLGGCECSKTNPVVPVVLPPLSAVVITPAADTLRIGQQQQFFAVAYDTLGQPVPNAGFVWTSGNAAVFTVTPNGRVTAVGEGLAWLYAATVGRRDSASVRVYADSGWVVQTSHTAANLNGVFFQPDGREGWAVGDGGAIVHTTDAGVTWRNQVSQTAANLNGVWFTDADTGFAVGNAGTVLVTGNRGATWARILIGIGENLNAVQFANHDTGYAVGSAGAILRTLNGGRQWEKQNVTGITLRSVAFSDARNGWAVGDAGDIWGTIDGLGWGRVQPSVTTLALRAVARRSLARAWAVGAQGAAPFTIDVGGVPVWQNGSVGALFDLHGLHFPTDAIGFAVGFNASGAVLRTDNGGADWTRQISNTSRQLNAVYFVDPLRGWAVGEGGTIIHTALGGLR